jgi:hypothetical protein
MRRANLTDPKQRVNGTCPIIMNGAPPLAARAFPITHAALLDLKLRLFGLRPLQHGHAFFQG